MQYELRHYTGTFRRARFDDLTETILAGHHRPLRVWIRCLYFGGLNLSNLQIAEGLGLDASDVQIMTSQLRVRPTAKAPRIELSGKIEGDEVQSWPATRRIRTQFKQKPSRPAQKAQRRSRTRHA